MDDLGSDDEIGSDIYPDTDAALLRKHRQCEEEELDYESEIHAPGTLRQLVDFMSRAPLLQGASGSDGPTSYGALRNHGSEPSPQAFQSGDFDDDADDIQKRDKRKGKSAALRSLASFANFGSRRITGESASHSRNRFRRASLRGSSPMLVAEPGHPAGQGGHFGGGLPVATSEDDDEDDENAISIDDDEALDPPDKFSYPQVLVRASVAATDDTSASTNTPRMWILSLLRTSWISNQLVLLPSISKRGYHPSNRSGSCAFARSSLGSTT